MTKTCPDYQATVLSTSQPERMGNTPELREALEGLVEAVRRDSDVRGKGISGYTSARLSDARAALAAAPAVGGLEAMAETIHKARWPADRVMDITPFADEDRNGREYCFRIARAVLAAPPASPLRGRKPDEWELAKFLCEKLALEDFDKMSRTKYLGDAKDILEFLSASSPEQPASPLRGRMPQSSVEYHQQRGAAWDIIDEAILSYRNFMMDDDYEPYRALEKIVGKLIERRNLYHPEQLDIPKRPASASSPEQASPLRGRETIANAIREYCRSLTPAAVQNSHGVERIYYAGLSVYDLTDAILSASPQEQPQRNLGVASDSDRTTTVPDRTTDATPRNDPQEPTSRDSRRDGTPLRGREAVREIAHRHCTCTCRGDPEVLQNHTNLCDEISDAILEYAALFSAAPEQPAAAITPMPWIDAEEGDMS